MKHNRIKIQGVIIMIFKKKEKIKVVVNENEFSIIIKSLNELRNFLIINSIPTESVDEILLKINE